jgi:hypothetical protein
MTVEAWPVRRARCSETMICLLQSWRHIRIDKRDTYIFLCTGVSKQIPDYPLSTMTTDAGCKTPGRGSVVGSINSPDGIAEVVRGFRDALKAFNSEQGSQGLAKLVDRVPKLGEDALERTYWRKRGRKRLASAREKYTRASRKAIFNYTTQNTNE